MHDSRLRAIVLRCDASVGIGAGHVMRGLALALALRERGASVCFLGQAPPGIVDRVRSEGFDWAPLEKPHPDPSDLIVTREFVARRRASWLVLDGYHFSPAYHRAVRDAGCRLLLLDDDACHDRYEADILLNPNLGAEALPYRFAASRPCLLFGPRFALLRPEFARAAAVDRSFPAQAGRLLVTMGATDPAGGGVLALEALRRLDGDIPDVRIVAGFANPRLEMLRHAAEELGPRVAVLEAVRDMPALLSWADMALTASGSTVWEMCCLGLPMLLLITAPNQERMAQAMGQSRAARLLGRLRELDAESVARALDALRNDAPTRRHLSEAGMALVDGLGASRVAGILIEEPQP